MKGILSVSAAALSGVALVGLTAISPAQAEDTITAASWGGAYTASQREAYYKPAAKEIDMTVLEDEWGGTLAEIRVQVDTGEYKWHVIDGESGTAMAGCDEGVLAELDWDMLGGQDRFLPGAAHDCAVGTISWATIYAYNGDTFSGDNAPTTMADFFDTETYPGKRGLYAGSPAASIEMALVADGVPTGEVYSYLEENEDEALDRAFAKLDSIRDDIIWWETGAMAPQLLADGEVAMTTAWNGRIYNAVVNEGKNFVIVWDGQIIDYDLWFIPAGHPEYDLGMKFIEYASRPEVMARQSQYISYGPTTNEAAELIDPDILQHLPTAPANLSNAMWSDTIWWADHEEELTERFQVWRSQ
ncbi:MAG: spermidine/putrescine ABC transporter substrate-binding protein [Rhodospirillaceae bacterium]|nr:spermidine/putrescine ABC transporter substrate-binding protein [Rhodospirillaceae bacterium]